jgi:hypothetical protein
MRNVTDRRRFLKTTGTLAAGIGLAALRGTSLLADQLADGAPHAEKLGWRLGCHAYSFNRFTFYEAVDKNASLGLRVIEAYPGQTLSKEKPDVKVGPGMSAADRKAMQKKLADSDVKLACFGVTGADRATFEFAQ